MRKKIYDAYETIKPDEAATERMLRNITSLYAQQAAQESVPAGKKEGNQMAQTSITKQKHKKNRNSGRIFRITAAAAAVVLLPTIAYATGLFGLHDTSLGKGEVIIPVEGGTEIPETTEMDMISMQGYSDSPEYKACLEWMEFSETYDADEAILSEVGNDPTGFEEEYGEYLCYTQEMADKIDEICEKYQLRKLSGFELADSCQDLCDRIGIGNFMLTPDNACNDFEDAYSYADGSFLLEGTAMLAGSGRIDYQFSRSVRGTFDDTMLNVGDINDYEQWEYTTKNGVSLRLANSSHKALIFADREQSFLVINVLGDIYSDTCDVTNEQLENFAELFDFSLIP